MKKCNLAGKKLADIFEYAAPYLLNENTSLGFAHNVALECVGTGYFKNWPVGKNITSEMIGDLVALDLVEPSRKKHTVADTDSYWSLALGRQVLKELRRVKLEEGIASLTEQSGGGELGIGDLT
jgi:hypothetical protein